MSETKTIKLTIALVEQALRAAIETAPMTSWSIKAKTVESGILKGFKVNKYSKTNFGVGRPQIPHFCFEAPDGLTNNDLTIGQYRYAARAIYGRLAGLNDSYYGPKLPTPEGYYIK